ncbi:MAG: TerB family tellurite resistance protein [Bacteroidia bacterium]
MSFRIIGAVIGFLSSGPFGAVVGFLIGSYIDYAYNGESSNNEYNRQSSSSYQGHPSQVNFKNSLLVLIAAVMKADGKAMKSELDLVKSMLIRTYGEQQSKEMLLTLRDYLKQEHNLYEICRNLRNRMGYSQRLELVHILFRISRADGNVSDAEVNIIQIVSNQLGVSTPDYLSLKAMFVSSSDADYKILDVSPTASEADVKKAYRDLAKRFHPDRLQGLSETEKTAASEKFVRVQKAYENIKKKKGWN